MRKQINFLKIALSDGQIGAMARSSKYVIGSVLRNIGKRSLHKVIEYGPGDGVLTKEILKRMPKDGELVAVETNPKFYKILSHLRDPRLKVIKGKAQNVSKVLESRNKATVDLVVSSIPFSILKRWERERVTSDAYNMLAAKGRFIVFHQYSPLMLNILNKYFGAKSVNTQFEVRNILPCFIMTAQK